MMVVVWPPKCKKVEEKVVWLAPAQNEESRSSSDDRLPSRWEGKVAASGRQGK